MGGYLVTVTDTEDKTPVPNASVVLNKDNSISIRSAEQQTVGL